MKIGIDARMLGLKATGVGYYIQNLLENLVKIDQENQYFLFLKNEDITNAQCQMPNVKCQVANEHWFTLPEQTTLVPKLLKPKVDLMHFPNFNAPILYPGKNIVSIHDLTAKFYTGHRRSAKKLRQAAFNLVFWSAIKKAKKIIAVSEYTKQDIIKYFKVNPDKIKVIYEGYNSYFRVIKDYDIINTVKAKYKITKPFIFYVGVWRNHKNLVGLIKAFDLLLKKYNLDIQLVLGGKELPEFPDIRNTWESLGLGDKIIRPGFIDASDLPILYNAAKAFVLPSFMEGFGLIGIEAQACGTPVVSTNTTCMPEVLGKGAVYFNPHNIDEMAEKINYVLSNQEVQNDLISLGQENVKRFSWQKCAQETLELYKST